MSWAKFGERIERKRRIIVDCLQRMRDAMETDGQSISTYHYLQSQANQIREQAAMIHDLAGDELREVDRPTKLYDRA